MSLDFCSLPSLCPEAAMSEMLIARASRNVRALHISSFPVTTCSEEAWSLAGVKLCALVGLNNGSKEYTKTGSSGRGKGRTGKLGTGKIEVEKTNPRLEACFETHVTCPTC